MTDTPTTPSPERQPADAGGEMSLNTAVSQLSGLLLVLDDEVIADRDLIEGYERCDYADALRVVLDALSTPAPQAQPDARAWLVQEFNHDGVLRSEFAVVGDQPWSGERGADQITTQPLYLSAPAADDGWNFNLSEAPEGEQVILATEGGHVGEAIAPVRDDSDDDWFWAGAGFVHKNTPPIAWRPLPAPPPALHPAAPTDEVGK